MSASAPFRARLDTLRLSRPVLVDDLHDVHALLTGEFPGVAFDVTINKGATAVIVRADCATWFSVGSIDIT